MSRHFHARAHGIQRPTLSHRTRALEVRQGKRGAILPGAERRQGSRFGLHGGVPGRRGVRAGLDHATRGIPHEEGERCGRFDGGKNRGRPPVANETGPVAARAAQITLAGPAFLERVSPASIHIRAIIILRTNGCVRTRERRTMDALRESGGAIITNIDVGRNLVAKEYHARGDDVHVGMHLARAGHVSDGGL
jgi:hypothetical protein